MSPNLLLLVSLFEITLLKGQQNLILPQWGDLKLSHMLKITVSVSKRHQLSRVSIYAEITVILERFMAVGWTHSGFHLMQVAFILHGWCQQMQMIMCDLSANWNNSYRELEQRILSMEQKLDELSRSFHQTSELLSQVLRHRNSEIR